MKTIILFITLFSLSTYANERITLIDGELMSHSQFKVLSQKQKIVYIKSLQRIFAKMSNGKKLFVDNSTNPIFKLFFNQADAASSDVRCMYGGFVIRGKDCLPYNRKNEKGIRLKVEGGEKDLTCGSDKVLCNPLLYGLEKNGDAICLPSSKKVSLNCLIEAQKEVRDEPYRPIALIESNPQKWNDFKGSYEELCSDETEFDFLKKRNEKLNQKSKLDIKTTCGDTENRLVALTNRLQAISAEAALQKATAAKTAAEEVAAAKAKIAEIVQQPKEEVVSRANKVLCDGACSVQYKYPINYFRTKKTKKFSLQTSRRSTCAVQFGEDGKLNNIDIKGIPSKLGDKKMGQFKTTLNSVDYKDCGDEACPADTPLLSAGNVDYKMSVISGSQKGQCKIEITKKLDEESIVSSMFKKSMDDQEKCMAKNDSSAMVGIYQSLARLAASNRCNIENISVKKHKKSKFFGHKAKLSQRQHPMSCRVRMSADLMSQTDGIIEINPLNGRRISFKFDPDTKASDLKGKFEKMKLCHNTVEERLNYTKSRKARGIIKERGITSEEK